MNVESLGIDHIYLSVGSLPAVERFYDVLLVDALGFRKKPFTLGGNLHLSYYSRQFGFVIRPARADTPAHDSGAPGLHHFCFRVADEPAVDHVAAVLQAHGIAATAPAYYAEYAPDYYATFVTDPDGIRLEITNLRAERKARMAHWDEETQDT